MIWTSLLLIAVLIGGGGYYMYNRKDKYAIDSDNYNINLYGSYTLFGLCGLYILCMLCCCSRIRLAIAILKAAAEFVNSNLRIFLLPVFFVVITIVFFAWWLATGLYVYSVGTVEKGTLSSLPNIVWSQNTRYVWLYHVFGMLWMIAFLVGAIQFVIATMAATWYFSHGSDSGGKASMAKGCCWFCRYHLGSIAFGSLIIAIV